MSSASRWYVERPCAQINAIWGSNNTLSAYSACSAYYDGSDPDYRVAVKSGYPTSSSPVEIAATFGSTFGGAGWLALWLHAILIEVYVSTSFNAMLTTQIADMP